MKQINISEARQNLPSILQQVYEGKEFLVTKNNIPLAKFIRVDNRGVKKTKRKIVPKVFGIWKNRTEWQGLSAVEIANKLRESAWKGMYGD